jgi:hypothetical protein
MTIGSSKVDRLLEAVHFYRQIGFFEQFRRVSDDQPAEQLNESYCAKTYGRRDLRQAHDLLDLALLSLDRARIWWHDPEDDVFFRQQRLRTCPDRLGSNSLAARSSPNASMSVGLANGAPSKSPSS